MVIAVDGPAASGKGTIARALAAHFGLPHMDTGSLYRAVGLAVLRAGGDPSDAALAAGCARTLDVTAFDDPALRESATARAASVVSAHPEVRAALLERQRAFARQPGGAVLDGRDIGTVIAPDADIKIFVTASLDVRARRRQAETPERDLAVVRANLAERDARDAGRDAAPLRQAEDAILLDTSDMDRDAAIARALALAEARLAEKAALR
ncbi:(d)CMP kinase [Sphingosinicella microcystinivorans]|uniref:(d)CMP kinase n=1 Tax=Sphingosinicella microcystinivorans TaxID=335406 RepID=UPI0022F3EFA9|nr:(d)CMP kinase [Sphingosinicella microcystinivorans]WBX86394.1 (d)CMP kinase [Sphingosinicella microcystinivorans]